MSIQITMNPAPPINFSEDSGLHPRQQKYTLFISKLSGVIHLMSLIGGFCISSVAELKGYEKSEPWLLTLFTVVTVLLTSCAAFVILFTAWLLPFMSANEELDSVLLSTGLIHRFKSHRLFYLDKEIQLLVQITWILASTGTVFLFLIDMILITWIKFSGVSRESSYAGTTVLTPTLLLMIYFGIRFWKELMKRKFLDKFDEDDEEDLDFVLSHSNASSFRQKRKCSDVVTTDEVIHMSVLSGHI